MTVSSAGSRIITLEYKSGYRHLDDDFIGRIENHNLQGIGFGILGDTSMRMVSAGSRIMNSIIEFHFGVSVCLQAFVLPERNSAKSKTMALVWPMPIPFQEENGRMGSSGHLRNHLIFAAHVLSL